VSTVRPCAACTVQAEGQLDVLGHTSAGSVTSAPPWRLADVARARGPGARSATRRCRGR
jgi:hypothetical protein